MAENSKIEWCDHTFNPWTGCAKVSPGCDNCYAEGWSKRAGDKVGKWGAGAARVRTSAANWKLPLKWNKQAESEGRRFRVFCASLADVFDNRVEPQWRMDLYALIRATPHLDWLLLTKRVGNVNGWGLPIADDNILPNLWIGATIVNREEMLRDAPKLKGVPARIRFWSVEPMLGDLGQVPTDLMPEWVICGGESGPHARPMQEAWATSLRDQCAEAGVPFLFKQWGEWAPNWLNDDAGQRIAGSAWMDKMGKKVAGRALEGVTHDGYPA
jgi:protein gp37